MQADTNLLTFERMCFSHPQERRLPRQKNVPWRWRQTTRRHNPEDCNPRSHL